MSFQTEPPFSHAQTARIGILWCNLGTPDAPTPAALRRYLGEFLSDPRVVEIPRWIWSLILHGVILRVRPRRSAAKYASIWTAEGSPLKVWTERQAQALQERLAARGHVLRVLPAMRYGQPGVAAQLDALQAEGVSRVLILPAYPQYSGTTSASVADAVFAWSRRIRRLPELRLVNRYHDHPGYIDALAQRVRQHWQSHGRGDRLVMSFHGVPERTLHLGDPYHCECLKTGRLLAQALGLDADQYVLTFQSRFGKAKWLEPSTEATLRQLARQGLTSVDVVCPGFTSDCLETLEEIAQEGRDTFLSAGGRSFHYIPCLNDHGAWLDALCDVAEQHLAGWPSRQTEDPATRQARLERARAAGAPR